MADKKMRKKNYHQNTATESEFIQNMGDPKMTIHDDRWANLAIEIIKGATKEYEALIHALYDAETLDEAKRIRRAIEVKEELFHTKYYETLMIFSNLTMDDICEKIRKQVREERRNRTANNKKA